MRNFGADQPSDCTRLRISAASWACFAAALAPSAAHALDCKVSIGSSTAVADAREAPFSGVAPGDTVCIQAGVRGTLQLKNFQGTDAARITFINKGGDVTVGGSLYLLNSHHVRITGTGAGNEPGVHGIRVRNATLADAVRITNRSYAVEVDHLEIADALSTGLSVVQAANCADASDVDFDYDGDGQLAGDLDDVVTPQNFELTDLAIHDLWVHGSGSTALEVGLGHTAGSTETGAGGAPCASAPLFPLNPVVKRVRVYNARVDDAGAESIVIRGAAAECMVFANRVAQDSRRKDAARAGGIVLGPNARCDVFNNVVRDGWGPGIADGGQGGNRVFNNVVANAGQGGGIVGQGIAISIAAETPSAAATHVWNNTVVNARDGGIVLARAGAGKVQNNLLAGGVASIIAPSTVSATNNLSFATIDGANFAAPAQSVYALSSDSPAVDAGIDLDGIGFTFDFALVARPQGAHFDVGAFEFQDGVAADGDPDLSSIAERIIAIMPLASSASAPGDYVLTLAAQSDGANVANVDPSRRGGCALSLQDASSVDVICACLIAIAVAARRRRRIL